MARSEDGVIVARVALRRADVADAAVSVFDVVPTHERGGPGTRGIQIVEALGGELRAVLGGAEQRLGIGVVVADAGPGVRGLDAQPMQHGHPYAYLALLESCMDCGVTYVQINCTWRPMIGSVLHKLGDALDIGRIDNGTDNLRIFAFLNAQVDDLADRFTKALNLHRYAATGLTIYNRDNLPAYAPFHDNHLHFTANRLKPLAEQDKPRPPMADDGSKS